MKKFQTSTGETPILHRNSANLMKNMLDEVKSTITILPELKSLIPPLHVTEYEQLVVNIVKHGCRESLLIWQTTRAVLDGSSDETPVNVLIDGHNRYEICQNNGVEFNVALRQFANLQEVRDFMIDNQLGRRNLTPEQASYLRGLKYRNERQGLGRPEQGSDAGKRTNEKLAKEFNVSPRTIIRDGEFAEGIDRLDPQLKKDVLSGVQKIPKEVIQEIGRTTSRDKPPVTIDDVKLKGAAKNTLPKAKPRKEKGAILQQIVAIANGLELSQPDFRIKCNELIHLLNLVQ